MTRPSCPAAPATSTRIRRSPPRLVELGDRVHDIALLIEGQLAVNRQRHARLRGSVRVRIRGGRRWQRAEAFLTMERDGIVDLSADLLRREPRAQVVASRAADRE